MGLVQVIIDDSSSKIITGTYEFDRDNGGTFIGTSGSSFPGTPEEGEWFWRTDESRLYRHNGSTWDAVAADVVAHGSTHENGGSDEISVAGLNGELADPQVPKSHASTHKGDGADAIAVATQSVAGLESAADKSKLDGIASGATNTPLSSTAPVNVTKATASAGAATDAARQDHKHDITTAAAGAAALGDTAAEGTATSLARSDHKHGLAAGSPVAVGTANADGSATTPARSDHVHAGLTRGANDFSAFTEKATPVSTDLVLIEDSAASGAKKKVQVGNLPGGGGGTDVNAIHKNVAAEISTITEKAVPDRLDLLVIEDNSDSNNKKRATIGSILIAEPDFFAGPVRFFDEFFPPDLNNQWTISTSGSGSRVALQLAPGGQVLIRAGNSNGRYAELLFGGGVAWQSIAYNPDIRARMKYDGTNNGHIEFEVHYADSNNYVFMEADQGGNWFLSCRAGGTLTQVDTGVALDTDWHTYAVRVTAGAVTAHIDDVLVATVTTNIPTVSGTVSIYVAGTGGGGTKNLLVDGFFYNSDRPS